MQEWLTLKEGKEKEGKGFNTEVRRDTEDTEKSGKSRFIARRKRETMAQRSSLRSE